MSRAKTGEGGVRVAVCPFRRQRPGRPGWVWCAAPHREAERLMCGGPWRMLVTEKGPPCLTQPDCPMGREPALKAGGLPSRLGSSFGREGVPKPASPSPADGCDEMLTVTEVAGPGARTARRHLTPPRRDACPPRGRHAAPSAAAGRRAAVARRAPDAEAARRFSCPPGTLVALPPKLAGRRRPRTRHSGRGQPGFPVGEA